MLQTMLARFLLGRGLSAVQELLAKSLRHGMTIVGGALMKQGLATGDQTQALTGGAVAVLGIALSFARTFLSKKVG